MNEWYILELFGLYLTTSLCSHRLIEPVDLEKAVDLYKKAASVFEVRLHIIPKQLTFTWVYEYSNDII